MARPRTDDRDPLRRLLRLWARGVGVEPEHREHLLAVAREAVREAAGNDFGVFERVAAAMVVRLYGLSLGSQDNLTLARCLGEVVRGLRALRLLGTAGRLRRSGGRGRGRQFASPPLPVREPEAEDSDEDSPRGADAAEGEGGDENDDTAA